MGDTLDKVGHGAGQSCVRIVPAERLPGLREVCDIMFSWDRPVAVLTSQFFLSDENGEVDMPSRINGGRASLRQEVDFDSLYICPQKMGHALTAGPAIDRWDWRRILGNVAQFSRLPDIPKLADRNGFLNLDRKYGLNLCVITVQSSIQPLGSGPVASSYPQLESHGGTSKADDRQIGRYDDSDWSRENPTTICRLIYTLTGHTDAVEHEIDTGHSAPICCALRRMSPQMMKKEEECVADMLTGGQIEASDSPWSSIQSITEPRDQPQETSNSLPTHLHDLVSQTSQDLDTNQQHRLANILLQYADLFTLSLDTQMPLNMKLTPVIVHPYVAHSAGCLPR